MRVSACLSCLWEGCVSVNSVLYKILPTSHFSSPETGNICQYLKTNHKSRWDANMSTHKEFMQMGYVEVLRGQTA